MENNTDSRTLTRDLPNGTDEESDKPTTVPVWSGFNSMINVTQHVTRVGTPPLIAAPAHEWSTLLIVLMQAQDIKTKVVGHERKTVISLDLGLYKPAKQLQMARRDLDHLILRPGELHIVMAQLRCIGAYIDSSGVDMCWTEAEVYGPATVKQIIEGKHVKRGETAHAVTLQVLFNLYQEAFFAHDESQSYQRLQQAAEELANACKEGKSTVIVEEANIKIINAIKSLAILEKMSAFKAANDKYPMFKVMRNYMCMV